ncbi:preprotein translocase subunit YajC [Marinicella sp. W31]|uniref:preprotein translocase subunit YajC n=1 Tax=Marinicella sp. W31 TaxID=3023713 RepID=UPI003757C460
MNFLISDAMAQSGGTAGSPMTSFLFIIVFVAIMYFMLIRPQQKRMKEHNEMVSALGVGDEVISSGGILGVVTVLDESFVKLEIADNTEVTLQKNAISKVLPKGTIKSIK